MSLRVLIIEDHAATRRALTSLLCRWGYEVSTAESLESGLAFIRAKDFDIILSDIGLPDGTGYALVAEAKKKQKKVKAIALTGYNSAADVEIGRNSGFDSYLTKPCNSHLLRTVLSNSLVPLSNRPMLH
jgi:CheY-like chemotaxis protein